MCPNPRVEMRRGTSLKRTIYCRDKPCDWIAYLTMIGRIYRYRKSEDRITSQQSHWLLMFHKEKKDHYELKSTN